jgi:transcriptional regulator of heat shock response
MMADRDLLILQFLVDLYVREGVPVSSRAVRDAGLSLSTATIRGVLGRLEREGYVDGSRPTKATACMSTTSKNGRP